MPRKPLPTTLPAAVPELNHAVIEADTAAMTEVGLRERLQASALEIGEQLGIIKSAEFYARCAEKLVVEAFVKLKEGKRYKDLVVKKENGESAPCADLDEACRFFLGKSYRYCAQITQNMETVGAKLFESASQLGFRTKDYQAIRALPADDQALVKSAIADTNDRDAVTDLIGELTERHAKKIAEKDKAIADLTKNMEVKERRVKALGDERDRLNEQLIGITLTSDAVRKLALEKRNRALPRKAQPCSGRTEESVHVHARLRHQLRPGRCRCDGPGRCDGLHGGDRHAARHLPAPCGPCQRPWDAGGLCRGGDAVVAGRVDRGHPRSRRGRGVLTWTPAQWWNWIYCVSWPAG